MKDVRFKIRIRYLDEAVFDDWDDAVTLMGYLLAGGVSGFEVSLEKKNAPDLGLNREEDEDENR